MAHKKLTLPTKPCAACQRPFAWRKKWERDWDNVKFCSDRCRSRGHASYAAPGITTKPATSGARLGRD